MHTRDNPRSFGGFETNQRLTDLALPASPLPRLQVVELNPADAVRLQRFFSDNPLYFDTVEGAPPGPDAATEALQSLPPPDMPWTRRWMLGWESESPQAGGPLTAICDIVQDLLAPGVWHIGLFIVATRHHGQGLARSLYQSLEDWARAHGGGWMRLGVVQGHTRAERFWSGQGFQQLRLRHGLPAGQRVNTVRVMLKPLPGHDVAHYLAQVARDRPE